MTSLYLHIPFCRRKCPYCDFFSTSDQPQRLAGYHRLLLDQFRLAESSGWRGPFDTVFFGGGTPSLLQPRQVAEILETVATTVGLTTGAEISLEANPGTVSRATLEGFRAAGVNRLSLGIQSCDDRKLRILGRQHDQGEAFAAIEAARSAGFANLNLDLMFALPGQTLPELVADLEQLLSFEPEHLAVYGLSIEEQTPFAGQRFAGNAALPDDESFAEMFLQIHQQLAAAGFDHYEISNYARPGFACRHNLNYWRRGTCLGLGAGAHAFDATGWGARSAVASDLQSYQQLLAIGVDPLIKLEDFSCREAMRETAYLGLRTARGVVAEDFAQCFAVAFEDVFPEAVRRLRGRLKLEDGCWRFSVTDWLLYDLLVTEFF